MTISIVTPCRNAAALLADTLASLRGQSAVQCGEVELQHIVVDGASTDNTREVVAACPDVELLSEPDSGMYDALAKGFVRARGDVVGYLNAGDIYHPRAFEILCEVFAAPGVDWATGYSVIVNDRQQMVSAWKPPRYRREFIENGTYLSGNRIPGIMQESTFWSRRLHGQIDLVRLRKFRAAGDYDLWLQFCDKAPLQSIWGVLGAFRIHSGQISENMGAYLAEIAPSLRPPTRRERFTAWWEFSCPQFLRGPASNFVLPPSPSRIFEFRADSNKWMPR